MSLPVPIIHTNGTSRDELLRQVTETLDALRLANDKMLEALPNNRDYYPRGAHAYTEAHRAHSELFKLMNTLLLSYGALAEAIADAP